MKFDKLEIDGSFIISNKIFKDNRGFLLESFNKDISKILGINFIQDNIVLSKHKNTFRGMHLQLKPYDQSKLISVLRGRIIDILLDLRKTSPTYNKIVEIEINDSFEKSIFIPKGIAHGYITLTDNSLVMYKVDNKYSADHESGINVKNIFDRLKLLNSDYDSLILSDKDKNLK